MNRIHPRKLLDSKWSARRPRDDEKHFVVKRILYEGHRADRVVLEAIHSGRTYEIPWRELSGSDSWQMGWV
ncbi:MAG: TIGR02450 family Trp-rich protein [Candidatus Binatia bacterium]|nr:TIGR02450 family Trp-rich protein [Candidatus Binatia bacterium]